MHESLSARGATTIGLSLDENAAAWQAAVKTLELPWSQGRLTDAGAAGVSNVPAYWLLDPEGKIVARTHDPDELAKLIAERLK